METRLRTQSTNFEHSPVAPANQSQQTNFGARQAAARIVTCGNRNVRFDIVTSTVAAKAGLANSQLNIPHSNHGTVILPTPLEPPRIKRRSVQDLATHKCVVATP